jgi:hypothetical protein
MKKRIKTKWLKALRIGEYNQTTGQLRDSTGFCCLGVLCNIHAQENPEIAAKETDPHEYLQASGQLPPAVVAWAGLEKASVEETADEETDIKVTYRNKETTLASLNDGEGLSFKKIANVIERCL